MTGSPQDSAPARLQADRIATPAHSQVAPTAPAIRPSAADWTAERERSGLRALRLMRWVALAAGRRASRLLLHPIAAYFVLTDGRTRRHSRRYLTRALGRPAGLADVYRHVHHFAASVLDRVYFLRERFDRFDVQASGMQAVIARLERGEGALLIGAHMGSFEALRAVGAEHGRRIAMVMYEDNARLINATLAAIAPQAQLHTIALGRLGAMLALRRWLDDGGLAGLLADRTLPAAISATTTAAERGRSKTAWLPFLGRPARFSDGPFRLAAMLRRPVFFMVGLYHGGNRYELRFEPIADFGAADAASGKPQPNAPTHEAQIDAALRRYVALLEALCREAPLNWFNFYDFWADDEGNAGAAAATAAR